MSSFQKKIWKNSITTFLVDFGKNLNFDFWVFFGFCPETIVYKISDTPIYVFSERAVNSAQDSAKSSSKEGGAAVP